MIKSLLKLSRPIHLLLAALTFTVGAGIAHYLGQAVIPAIFGLGLLIVLTVISSTFLFTEYFRLQMMPLAQDETPRQRERLRVTLMQVSFAELTLSAVALLTLQMAHSLNPLANILLMLAFLLLVAYAVPPMRISETGFGELVLAVTLGTLLPALAFLLQIGQFHRLLFLTTFPLTLLAMAYQLVCNFPTFANDQKLGHRSLLTRLTWQRAVPIHHFLVLSAFLFYSAAPIMGYPSRLIWPIFLALPLAAIQIFWLQRIANGGRTLWAFLTALASTTIGMTSYLLSLTFWIR